MLSDCIFRPRRIGVERTWQQHRELKSRSLTSLRRGGERIVRMVPRYKNYDSLDMSCDRDVEVGLSINRSNGSYEAWAMFFTADRLKSIGLDSE